MNQASFYRAFEDRYRGSRELIKTRLQVYLPFIEPIKEIYSEREAIDLGCGRGEWLELLVENAFQPKGVDLDDDMLSACHELHLSVKNQDAIGCLQSLPDESQVVVSGFHFAEHIPFEALQTLVKEALRVLKPGGLLILETPNPENLVVGTVNFYLDPTHQQPLPPQLLEFLPEYYGFGRTKVLRLQEAQHLATASTIKLIDVLGSVSQDYSIVAQKDAPPEYLNSFDTAFKVEHGVMLRTLASRYDTELNQRFAEFEARAAESEARNAALQQQLESLYQSKSWRITWPFRQLGRLIRWGLALPLRLIRKNK